MRVLAIRSDFIHHGEHSGYKQILKYTEPYKVIGVDERSPTPQSDWMNAYCWPYEFSGYRHRNEIDLVHHLYADEFFRFSARLFRVPLVGTFHQTPELLERDVIHGDLRGRIAKMTHKMNRNRFKQLSAAIVTNPNQKEVLKKVMPEDRIHYIPLGLHLSRLNPFYTAADKNKEQRVITVGNWQRDWDFYFKVVSSSPSMQFILVNRKLDANYKAIAASLQNLDYYDDVSDEELYALFAESDVQFLPIIGIAASNAIMDGLALGCPLVITETEGSTLTDTDRIVVSYPRGDVDQARSSLSVFLENTDEQKSALRQQCHDYAQQFDWKEIASRTVDLYKKVLSEHRMKP